MTHQPINHTMKTYIESLLRHAFTALAGLGGLLLTQNLIAQGDVAQVNAAGVSIGSALVVIVTALVGRLVLTLTGKMLTGAAGESSGTSGGTSLLALLVTAAGLMGCLPSCTPGLPIKGCLTSDYGTACYSSKSGLEVSINQHSGK